VADNGTTVNKECLTTRDRTDRSYENGIRTVVKRSARFCATSRLTSASGASFTHLCDRSARNNGRDTYRERTPASHTRENEEQKEFERDPNTGRTSRSEISLLLRDSNPACDPSRVSISAGRLYRPRYSERKRVARRLEYRLVLLRAKKARHARLIDGSSRAIMSRYHRRSCEGIARYRSAAGTSGICVY